jgi:8-oxo-dGTP pyrophosphatase MutT (NUDIX family)
VAFPGGRNSPGETDLETASREVQEEVGIDLSRATLLGQMDDRRMILSNRISLIVCSFVFLLNANITPLLDPLEVAACVWVPLSFFQQDHCTQWYHIDRKRRERYRFTPLWLLLTRFLPEIALTSARPPMRDITVSSCTGHSGLSDIASNFVVWGLTWRILNDFMLASALIPRRMDEPGFRFGSWSARCVHGVADAVLRCLGYPSASLWPVAALQVGVTVMTYVVCATFAVFSLRVLHLSMR